MSVLYHYGYIILTMAAVLAHPARRAATHVTSYRIIATPAVTTWGCRAFINVQALRVDDGIPETDICQMP